MRDNCESRTPDVAVEHLIKLVDDGALTDLGALGLVDTLQTLERVRNKLPVLDRAMIAYGTEQGVPAALSERTMLRVLTTALRLSVREASRRVKAADTSPTWSAGTTTTSSPNAAGNAESTPTASPSGSHRNGSTNGNARS